MKLDIIFDLDDTLANCGKFYREQHSRFVEFQESRTGLSKELISNLREQIDVVFTQTSDGFARARFPRSFAATSTTLDIMLGNKIDEVAAYQSFELGDEVFNATYPLFDGVEELLDTLYNNKHRLFLHTKGDYEVQKRKIELNGLTRWFHSDRIYIVGQKNKDTLNRIITDHKIDINNVISVGDSRRDDILTANQLKIPSVLITHQTSSTWSYENTEVSPMFHLTDVTELFDVVDRKTGRLSVTTN